VKDPRKNENPHTPLSSSGLFSFLSTAASVPEYRDLFDRYWKKREEERVHPSEGADRTKRRGGAQRSAQRPQESRGRERKVQGREDLNSGGEGTS